MNKTLLITALLLSGCASLDRGSNQEIQIQTRNDANVAHTYCNVENDDGQWKIKPSQLQDDVFGGKLVVERDGETLFVRCENDGQIGETQARSRFDKQYFYEDLASVCLFCIIDAATGAFYSYPDTVIVEMSSKH